MDLFTSVLIGHQGDIYTSKMSSATEHFQTQELDLLQGSQHSLAGQMAAFPDEYGAWLGGGLSQDSFSANTWVVCRVRQMKRTEMTRLCQKALGQWTGLGRCYLT